MVIIFEGLTDKSMTIKYLLTILISALTLSLSAQMDTLYVWAESGLLLRDKPNVEGKVVGKLDYGDTVIVKGIPENSQYSHIAFPKKTVRNITSAEVKLDGHFVEVALGDSIVYAFDGYLSHLLPVRINKFQRESWNDYLNITKTIIDTVVTFQGYRKITKKIYDDGSILSEYEGEVEGSTKIKLPAMSPNELYLLIQTMTAFEIRQESEEIHLPTKFDSMGIAVHSGLCGIGASRYDPHFVIISIYCSC